MVISFFLQSLHSLSSNFSFVFLEDNKLASSLSGRSISIRNQILYLVQKSTYHPFPLLPITPYPPYERILPSTDMKTILESTV